ncbi:hypothetical protein [Qipengyuania sp.]|uniref:hypothetical protein n=1 Tax=Qipengyuania sp. TaxID=2004515 RepID=UPI0035C7D1BD
MPAALACYSDPAHLEAWAARAAPGETFIVAIADVLDPEQPVVQAMARLSEAGRVQLVPHGNGEGRARCVLRMPDHLAQSPTDLPRLTPDFRQTPEGQLFLLLIQLAEAGAACPSNGALARRLGWDDREQARYRMSKLVEGGWISARAVPGDPADRRVVTITETGKSTGEPR